jgi:uncharacterized membrane protein
MKKYLKEAVLWAMILLPYVYLATIWNQLPDKVPTHFNIAGDVDTWSAKTTLLYLPGALGIGIYLLMLLIPLIDPKKRIKQMGAKYYTLRFMLTLFFSVLATYLLYLSNAGSLKNPNLLVALIGVLFAVLGNYFQAIRPNYFIGIRTPWTLENEEVWKKTHRLGGRLWIACGLLIAVISFIIRNNLALAITLGAILSVMVIVPVVYSYREFQFQRSGRDA